MLSCLCLAHWKLNCRKWKIIIINQNQGIEMTVSNIICWISKHQCILTEQLLCDCVTGWKKNLFIFHDTFPHGFNLLRRIIAMSNNDQIGQKVEVWQCLSSWHFSVWCWWTLVFPESSLASWVLRSNCSTGSQIAQFSDEAIVVAITASWSWLYDPWKAS